MAALTWRDVAAPDFGTSLQGINQFSRLLDNAFEGGIGAIDKYDRVQDEIANRAINERSLAVRDPAELAARIADGSILGNDRFRASTATLQALDNRVGALQNESLGRINLEGATDRNNQRKAMDAAGADALEYSRLSRDPSAAGQARAQAFLEAHPNLTDTNALGYQNAMAISDKAFGNEGIGLDRSNIRQNMDLAMRREGRDADLFGREKTEWGEGRQAQSLMAQAFRDGVTMDDMPDYLATHGISGPVAARLIGISNGVLPANMGGTATMGGASDGAPVMVPKGQTAVALHGNNPGGINDGDFAKSQPGYVGGNGRYAAFDTMENGAKAQTALLGSYVKRGFNTPMKIAQRWAPAGDGNDPVAYARTIARQMGIGVNDTIGQSQLGAFQRAQAITENSAYAAGNPSARAAAVDARTRAGTGQRISNIGGGNYDQARAAAKADIDSSAIDVATRLKEKLPGTDGWFTNTTVRDIADDIKGIRDRAIARARAKGNKTYNMTFAEAGVIYENNTKSRWMPYILGGSDINSRGIDDAIDRGISGADQDAAGTLALVRGNAAARDQSSAALAQARANLIAARQRVRDPAILARYERAYNQAAQADQMNQRYEGENNPIDSYGTSSVDAARAAGVRQQQADAKALERRQIAQAMTAARAGQQWPKGIPSKVWYYALDQVQKGR